MTKRKTSLALDTNHEGDQNSPQDNSSNDNSSNGTPNNQSNRLDSSTAGGGASRQNIGDNNGNSSKSKKERADNWSSAEIQVLHRGIDSRRDIFCGPPSQATKKSRELAWEQIVKEVNAVSSTPRSLSQVMKKFKNEKCRAKRRFIDGKDGHNAMNNNSNLNNSNSSSNNNMNAQNPSNNQSQQLQSHHMTTTDSTSSQPSSINVVKLAPQNVSKTMIDLPGHVHPIQMPGDDMLFFVPEMDGLISGVNIVSDANGHHHLQKNANNTLNNQQHNHHNQHTIQAINTGQGLVNGTMGNGMMARTIPAGSMCSLVYSTGGEVCGTEQHMSTGVSGPNSLPSNNINVNAQNLIHHRGSSLDTQGQPQHHQLHQHQQQATHQQQQQQQPQATHPPQPHPNSLHHIQPNQMNSTATATSNIVGGHSGGNNMDGQNASTLVTTSQDESKQRNETLAMIANSLSKIENHLSKIASVAGCIFTQSVSNAASNDSVAPSLATSNNSLDINNNDDNGGVSINAGNSGNMGGQSGSEP